MEQEPVMPAQAFEQPLPPVPNLEDTETGSFRDRLGDTFGAIKKDYQENKHRMALIASGAGTIAVQAVDRARLSLVLVPHVAISTLENTNSPAQAGIAAGLTYAGWCAAVGGTTTEGLKQYPKTMDSFRENFPSAVEFFNDALPGIESYDNKVDSRSLPKRIGSRVLTGIKRGLTASSFGTAAYVSTAAANGDSRKSIHRLNANASAEGGAVVGGVVYGIGETISYISESHPLLAQDIVDTASDIRVWYGVAGAVIAGQFISSKFKKFRARRNPEPQAEQTLEAGQPTHLDTEYTEQPEV